jgi:hypothetical protein
MFATVEEQAAPSSLRPVKPGPARLAKPRMSKLSSVLSVKPLVRSIARPPSSVVSLVAPVLSRDVAGKVQAQHAGGALGEIAGDGLRRVEPQRALVGHGPIAAIDRDIVAERRIAAGEGQVPIADRDRAARPLPNVLPDPPVTVTPA